MPSPNTSRLADELFALRVKTSGQYLSKPGQTYVCRQWQVRGKAAKKAAKRKRMERRNAS